MYIIVQQDINIAFLWQRNIMEVLSEIFVFEPDLLLRCHVT